MHLEAPQPSQVECEACRRPFTKKRSWSRFCSTKCRNDFHSAEAKKEAMRKAAPELFEALLLARRIMRGKDIEHVVVNFPNEPHEGLGERIDRALAKAGHKP